MSEGVAAGEFEIVNRLGLHARAASQLVQVASEFPCDILISRGGQVANAKSVMGVLLLCSPRGSRVRIEARGEQSEAALLALGDIIQAGFGEED